MTTNDPKSKIQMNLIIACTGSVATIKLPLLLNTLQSSNSLIHYNIKVVMTTHAQHFFPKKNLRDFDVIAYDDCDEWNAWNDRGDPVLHIDLGKWADILLIAPLSANSMAKIVGGICDNLLLCLVRAWDREKPLLFCPAMNTRMYEHPITAEHIAKLKNWGYREVPCISKTLMCGDTGLGAMAEVETIVESVNSLSK